ncbi:MAG: HAD-IB family phosphatase [Candidatus Zixiibacteriota bacterium]|jgi:HAD superfamily phosphoserine phosphatase-like hydrolase
MSTEKNRSQTLIFCDFDGTVARRDVGYNLFHRFSGGRNDELLPDWKAGRMTSREILEREAAMCHAPEDEVYAFLDEFVINPGFVEFEQTCRDEGIPVVILSDGLDIYVNRILKRYELSHIPVHCNRGQLIENRITVEFPYPLGSCGRCGNCKGDRIAEYRADRPEDELFVIFVGDGMSDTCAIEQADLLLAKKDLARYCVEHGIDFISYDTFFDVARVLHEQGILPPTPVQKKE